MTCTHARTRVYDSRPPTSISAPNTWKGHPYITHRRHECLDCGARFRTFEMAEDQLVALTLNATEELRQRVLAAALADTQPKPEVIE